MRLILKPAGLLLILVIFAIIAFVSLNDVGAIFGKKPSASVTKGTASHGPRFRSLDLNRFGKDDWLYFGTGKSGATSPEELVIRKKVAQKCFHEVEFVGKKPTVYNDDPRSFKWNDGVDPFTTMTEIHTGLKTSGVGSGFRFTVDALPKRSTLRVWVGGEGARSKLEVRLSDGSPINKMTVSEQSDANSYKSLYTIVFKGTKPGQKIYATYLLAKGNEGTVSLQAVALE